VMMLTEKKSELERRMQHLLSEREGLSCNLDESSDRILALERQCHEQLIHLRDTQRELDDLRTTNGNRGNQFLKKKSQRKISFSGRKRKKKGDPLTPRDS